MHRTDATDFENDIGNGNRGFKETPPGSETVIAANFMNAVQEEIAKVIEDAGDTLRADGATDAAALWGQLSPAIEGLAQKGGVVVNGTKHGMATGAVSAGTNVSGLTAGLAKSPIIFIPAGTYDMTQAAATPVGVPDGAIIMGQGPNTILQINSTTNLWDIADKNVRFMNLTIDGNGIGDPGLAPNFVNEKLLILENVSFTNYPVDITKMAINSNSNADGVGRIILKDCTLTNMPAGAIRMTQAGNNSSRILCINSDFDNASIVSVGTSTAKRVFLECRIFDGEINLNGDSGVFFEKCVIDVDNYFFNNTVQAVFRNCVLPNTLANTKNHNFGGNPSRTFWINNTGAGGITSLKSDNIRGIKTTRKITGSQSIGPASNALVDWDNPISTEMATNPNYTKDSVYSAGQFTCRGYGNSEVRVFCQIFIDQAPTENVTTYLRINGVRTYIFNKSDLSGGTALHSVDVNIKLNNGDIIDVDVDNAAGGSLNILESSPGVVVDSFINIEGL